MSVARGAARYGSRENAWGMGLEDDPEAASAEMGRAKAADLIALPDGVSGTNCGNCRFVKRGFCENEKVRQPVTDRMCCALWDADGVVRPWEEK